MYSVHNEGKSVVAGRFIRTLKNKIYKYVSSTSKNVYTYKLYDVLKEYNNIYHKTIKMKPTDVKNNTYIDVKSYMSNGKIMIIHLIVGLIKRDLV